MGKDYYMYIARFPGDRQLYRQFQLKYYHITNSLGVCSNFIASFRGDTITYLVTYRRSIEIWRVCKIYGRRGGAEPFIYFTNPPYFYRPSVSDQISVLFRRGPWIVYPETKIGGNSTQASYIYDRVLRAKMWRYDLRGRRHRLRCEYQGRHDVMLNLLKSMKKSTLVRCYTSPV